jgi:ATP-dependent RNA helicase DOB1
MICSAPITPLLLCRLASCMNCIVDWFRSSAAAAAAVSMCVTEGLVTSKGRVAADLASGHDELVLAELLLGGAFSDLSPDQLVALCSCFVWSEKSEGATK